MVREDKVEDILAFIEDLGFTLLRSIDESLQIKLEKLLVDILTERQQKKVLETLGLSSKNKKL